MELILGAESNTKIIIRSLLAVGNLFEKASPGLLSCTEKRTFWTSWVDGTFRIGIGYAYSPDVLLEYKVPGFKLSVSIECLILSWQQNYQVTGHGETLRCLLVQTMQTQGALGN